jgi:hypothetical protein
MCYLKQVIYSPFYTLYKTLFYENIIIMLSILQIVLYTIKKSYTRIMLLISVNIAPVFYDIYIVSVSIVLRFLMNDNTAPTANPS